MNFSIESRQRVELIDITGRLKESVKIKDGILVVYTPHTTTGIFINENDADLKKDILKFLEKIIPNRADYEHDVEEGNADSHLRGILLGNSVVIPVENSELKLGTWQGVFFAELDGPRKRYVVVKEIKS